MRFVYFVPAAAGVLLLSGRLVAQAPSIEPPAVQVQEPLPAAPEAAAPEPDAQRDPMAAWEQTEASPPPAAAAPEPALATPPPNAAVEQAPPLVLGTFSEDGGDSDWKFEFHGYARMPVRFTGSLRRSPYLVDDDYYLSGFGYLRVQEREWAELFLEARQNRNTRLVFGLFASQFSDWSEATLQGQSGLATAFVEHHVKAAPWLELDARVGMFWDRYGFIQPYDTYLLGRTHIAGARLAVRAFDLVVARAGVGAHAEVIGNNQGFTPVAWGTLGFDTKWVDLSLFGGRTWTRDSQREFAANIKNATLRVFGAELAVEHERVGRLQLVSSFIDAKRVLSLANSLEILHSTGGRGLSQNIFGAVQDGTGQAITTGFDVQVDPYRMLPDPSSARRHLRGLYVRAFGMLASVQSKEGNTNPLINRDDRTYLKYGYELYYRAFATPVPFMFAALRYDRVMLNKKYEDMSFSVFTPRLGFVVAEQVDVFAAYSMYDYGRAVSLRPNQIAGDNGVTEPDERVFKLQAQARF